MTRKSYVIDVKKPVFPFGQEYWTNKAEPVKSSGRMSLTDNITAVGLKNVLPTPFGHASFFGTTQLGNLKLPPITEKVFTYKDSLGNNTLVALGKYGAMFSNDGVSWNESEVPNWVTQTSTGSYEFQPDMSKNYTGFIKCIATFSKATAQSAPSLLEVTGAVATKDSQDLVILPVSPTNTFSAAESLNIPYDISEVFNTLKQYVNPQFGEPKIGNHYVMATVVVWADYTALPGDTATTVIKKLVGNFNTRSIASSRGVLAEYISDTEVLIYANPGHSTTSMEYTTFYSYAYSDLLIPTPAITPEVLPIGNTFPVGYSQVAGSTAGWEIDNAKFNSGVASLRNVNIANGQTAGMQVTNQTAGTLSFSYATDSENNYDKLFMKVNGVTKLTASGAATPWASFSIAVVVGDILSWEYVKDNTVSSGLDTVWVDNITVTPPSANNLGVVANDEIPVSIPKASIGNIGYVVFRANQPLTVGDFNIRRSGMYQVGGAPAPAGVVPKLDGSLTFTDINLMLDKPYPLPLTEEFYTLRQFTGVKQTGLTMEIYDSGVALSSYSLGSRSTATRSNCHCSLVPADIIVGRIFTLQTLGQVGTYTALVADTITSVIAGVVAAYNLAGVFIVTNHGGQILTTNNYTDELFFQASPLATMTNSLVNAESYTVVDTTLNNNFVNLSEQGKLYALVLTVNTASTNMLYTLYNDSTPVPVTSPAGLFGNSLYEITSAQLTAAALAGTKLLVRVNTKHLTVLARPAVGGNNVAGSISFNFRSILTGGASMSHHVGPVSSLVALSGMVNVAYSQSYSRHRLTGKFTRLPDIPFDTIASIFSPYSEVASSIAGITTIGLTPNLPTTDSFQFSVPVSSSGGFSGILLDLQDIYTPNTVSISYTHPITLQAGSFVPNLGRTSVGWDLSSYSLGLSSADQIAFGVYNPWTTTIVKNRLYCYRRAQGNGTYILRLRLDGSAWEQLVPTFANMAQIEGITSARGRMVMWDTTGSIYISSNTDPLDFIPAIKTRANVYKVDAVLGNIILCLGYKDGYIIYSTASIILATYVGNTTTFKHTTLSNTQGILNTKAVTVVDDALQFAYTQAGLYAVTLSGLKSISPEASAYFKSSALSPRLDYLENRYLSIAFAPETPSWVTTKQEAFKGSIVPFTSESWFTSAFPNYYTLKLPVLNPELRTAASTLVITYWSQTSNVNKTGLISTKTIELPGGEVVGSNIVGFLQYFTDKINSYVLLYKPLNTLYVGVNAQYTWNTVTPPLLVFSNYNIIYRTLRLSPNESRFMVQIAKSQIEHVYNQTNLLDWVQHYGHNFWDGVGGIHYPIAEAMTLSRGFGYAHSIVTSMSLDALVVPLLGNFSISINQIDSTLNYISASKPISASLTVPAQYGYPIAGPSGLPVGSLSNSLVRDHGVVGLAVPVEAPSTYITLVGDTLSVTGPGLTPIYRGTGLRYGIFDNRNYDEALLRGFTLPAGVLPPSSTTTSINPQVIPPIVFPSGHFIASQGVSEPIDAIYTKALILDTELKNWGSCDVPFRSMIDFIPINARSSNPITGELSTKFTFQNLAKAFALMKQDGTLNLCTQETTDSYIEFGDIGFTRTGTTRFLDAIASFSTETGAVIEVLGSRDGETLNSLFTSSSVSASGSAKVHNVLTARWFRIRVSGRFNLKQLSFSGEPGGTR